MQPPHWLPHASEQIIEVGLEGCVMPPVNIFVAHAPQKQVALYQAQLHLNHLPGACTNHFVCLSQSCDGESKINVVVLNGVAKTLKFQLGDIHPVGPTNLVPRSVSGDLKVGDGLKKHLP